MTDQELINRRMRERAKRVNPLPMLTSRELLNPIVQYCTSWSRSRKPSSSGPLMQDHACYPSTCDGTFSDDQFIVGGLRRLKDFSRF
jgi:hypothetical protein